MKAHTITEKNLRYTVLAQPKPMHVQNMRVALLQRQNDYIKIERETYSRVDDLAIY